MARRFECLEKRVITKPIQNGEHQNVAITWTILWGGWFFVSLPKIQIFL